MRFTDLLVVPRASEAESVALSVTTPRRSEDPVTMGSLRAVARVQERNLERQFQSSCQNDALFFVAELGQGDRIFAVGEQKNVRIRFGADGPLIVKVGKYGAGVVLLVPYGWETVGWARFQPLAPGSGDRS